MRRLGEGATRFEAEHLAVLDRQYVRTVRELLGQSTRLVTLRFIVDEVDERVSEVRRR